MSVDVRPRGLRPRANGAAVIAVTSYLEPELALALRRRAFEDGVPVGQVVASAVRAELDRADGPEAA